MDPRTRLPLHKLFRAMSKDYNDLWPVRDRPEYEEWRDGATLNQLRINVETIRSQFAGAGGTARSGLELRSDYGIFKKCQRENVQFFVAKKLNGSRPRHSSIWGVSGPKTKFW